MLLSPFLFDFCMDDVEAGCVYINLTSLTCLIIDNRDIQHIVALKLLVVTLR